MRLIIFILAAAMLIEVAGAIDIRPDQINNSLPFPSIGMDEDANITIDGGHIVGANISALANPSADSDIYVFTALWDSITVAQWDNGTFVSIGTDDADLLNDVFDTIGGGRVIVKDDLSIDSPVTIHTEFTTLELLPDVTIAATASMAQMILIDPPSESASLYNVAVSGGCLDSNGNSAIGIEIKGHYADKTLTWGKIGDITIRDCTDAGIKLNSTTFLRVKDVTTVNNTNGIKFMEGCINTQVTDWQSYTDDYGCMIGGTYPAPHQRCEGILFSSPIVLGSTYCDLYVYEILQLVVNNGILDYSVGNSIYLNGNVDWVFVSNTYISPMASNDSDLYGRGLIQRGAATNLYFSQCNFVGAYYYAVDLINAAGVSFNACNFYENGRMDTEGGDVINYVADYLTMVGCKLRTAYDAQKYNYVETGGSGAQANTTLLGNQYTMRMNTAGGTPINYGNSLI